PAEVSDDAVHQREAKARAVAHTLVVKNGSNMRSSTLGGMPLPVSRHGRAGRWCSWPGRLRSCIANETLTGRSEMTMASSNTSIGLSRRSCSHETVEASLRETLIYRWCRRCWSLSYELRDETTDVHRI